MTTIFERLRFALHMTQVTSTALYRGGIDLIRCEFQSIPLEELPDRRDRADAHDRRVHSGPSPAGDVGHGSDVESLRGLFRHDDYRRRTVGDAGGVADVYRAILFEHRGELAGFPLTAVSAVPSALPGKAIRLLLWLVGPQWVPGAGGRGRPPLPRTRFRRRKKFSGITQDKQRKGQYT